MVALRIRTIVPTRKNKVALTPDQFQMALMAAPEGMHPNDLLRKFLDFRYEVVKLAQSELSLCVTRLQQLEGSFKALDQMYTACLPQMPQGALGARVLGQSLTSFLSRLAMVSSEAQHLLHDFSGGGQATALPHMPVAVGQKRRNEMEPEVVAKAPAVHLPVPVALAAPPSKQGSVADADSFIVYSRNSIKRVDAAAFPAYSQSACQLPDNDSLRGVVACRSHDPLLCLTSSGRAFTISASHVPEVGRVVPGVPINQVVSIEEQSCISYLMSLKVADFYADPSRFLVVLTSANHIKRMELKTFQGTRATGSRAILLKPGDEPLCAAHCSKDCAIAATSSGGWLLIFTVLEIRETGRDAQGVKAMDLKTGEAVACMAIIPDNHIKDLMQPNPAAAEGEEAALAPAANPAASTEGPWLMCVTALGYSKRVPVSALAMGHRNQVGQRLMNLRQGDRMVATLLVAPGQEVVLSTMRGVVARIDSSKVPVLSRSAQGSSIMTMAPGDNVQSVGLSVAEAAQV